MIYHLLGMGGHFSGGKRKLWVFLSTVNILDLADGSLDLPILISSSAGKSNSLTFPNGFKSFRSSGTILTFFIHTTLEISNTNDKNWYPLVGSPKALSVWLDTLKANYLCTIISIFKWTLIHMILDYKFSKISIIPFYMFWS